jgi:hypothetical protein
MTNPLWYDFKDYECQNCDDPIFAGQKIYYLQAEDKSFVCIDCAEKEKCVCDCGKYKPSFATDMCVDCYRAKKEEEASRLFHMKYVSNA